MQVPSPSVPARYFSLLCDILDSMGAATSDILKASHIDRKAVNLPDATLTLHQVDTFLKTAAQATGRSDLAFELGSKIRINSHDILGFALISCTTLDHLLRLCSRYYSLMTPAFTLSYRRNGDNAELQFKPALPLSPDLLALHLEAIAVSAHMLFRSVMQGRPRAYDIYLSMEAPRHLARYKELGPVKLHFASAELPGIRIQIDGAHLDAPLPLANPQAVALAEERCKTLLRNINEQGSWTDWVSMILRHAEDYQPTLEDLAKIINLTPRTLDRYLVKENTTYRDLSLRIRNQRARQLLDDGKLAVSQIAYRLGYSDLANFSRSFKKVNGISPSEYKGQAGNRANA